MRGFELILVTYLMNAVWQVPLIALAGYLAMRMNTQLSDRYNYGVLALLLEVLMPSLPMLPFHLARNQVSLLEWLRGHLHGSRAMAAHVQVAVGTGVAGVGYGDVLLKAHVLHLVAFAYALVMLFAVSRLGLGLVRARRLTQTAQVLEYTESGWPRLCIASTNQVNGPCVVGFLRPVLLVPEGLYERLENCERRALLAHETAHARRIDFVGNLILEVIALPVCFHPAAWFTRSRMAEAREMVCDQMAARCLDPSDGDVAYARSLIRLASVLGSTRPASPLHAIAFCDANTLERRVAMLTMKKTKWSGWRRAAAAAACGLVFVTANASALALRIHVGTQEGNGPAPVQVGAELLAEHLVTKVPPLYPPEAKADPVNGPVILDAVIGKDGSIVSLRIKQSLRADYDRSAYDAVKQWKYQPYLLNGEPTEVATTITVNYLIAK